MQASKSLCPTEPANLIDITGRTKAAHGCSIAYARKCARLAADQAGAPIALGWQLTDAGEIELGWCPASIAPHNCFVVQVLETIQPKGAP